jgi:hypothetical protein
MNSGILANNMVGTPKGMAADGFVFAKEHRHKETLILAVLRKFDPQMM